MRAADRPERMRTALCVLLLLAGASGCDGPAAPAAGSRVITQSATAAEGVTKSAGAAAVQAARAGLVPLDAVLEGQSGGRVRVVGVALGPAGGPPSMHAQAVRGARVALRLGFVVEQAFVSNAPMLFVHARAPGAVLNQANGDHFPLGHAVDLTTLEVGDLILDDGTVTVPGHLAVDALDLRVGLYEGKARWRARSGGANDDAVEAGSIAVTDAPPLNVALDVPRASGPITIDGVLSEPAWAAAATTSVFAPHDGKSQVSQSTRAKMLWSDDALYLAFIGDDDDVFTPYTQADDPLYDSEAIEIFIDADGDGDAYVELQAAPANDLHFDAAFEGGARRHMDRAFAADYQTKTVVAGTANDAAAVDHGFVSEWRIRTSSLRDVPAGEPRAGARWRVNLFRLERRRDARGRVTLTEASAWSSPLSNDFHALARFGTLTFIDGTASAAASPVKAESR